MTLESGTIVTLALAIIGAIYGYGRMGNKVEDLKEEDLKLWKVIGGLREKQEGFEKEVRLKQENHERESHEVRRQIERDLSTIRETASKDAGKLDLILASIDELKAQIQKLEDRRP